MKELIHKMLFETRISEWLLALLERAFGLAIADAEQMGEQLAGLDTTCQEQGCGKQGYLCIARSYNEEVDDTVEFFCREHAHENGYCWCCGEFYGGIESFDFAPRGLCENCEHILRDEVDDPDDWSDEDEMEAYNGEPLP